MEILLLQASAYELPTSRRVGVIVHDGATDVRIWPGPGADRELGAAYGPELQTALDREVRKLPAKELAVGELMRMHPGRLHCDFLTWVATRGAENEGRQAPAPDRATLEAAIRAVLDFVAERNVIRIAFPALGAGPGALDEAERAALVVRTATAWHEQRFASGRASGIEEVMVCDPRLSVVSSARRMVAGLAKSPVTDPKAAAEAKMPAEKKKAASSGTKKKSATRAAPARKAKLEEAEISRARATAKPWERTIRYGHGDWFVHAKFGVGRVEEVGADGTVIVLFEDGESRKLIHAR